MPTWDELRVRLRSTYSVVRDEPEAIALSWAITAGDQQVVQGVGLAPMTVEGRPWLTMIADLFAESVLQPRTALLYQDRLPFGTLVLREGVFLIRYGLPLDTLSFEEVDWTLRVLAREATRLRVNVDQLGSTGAPYGHYAE
jgi:hypothetical protein